MKPPTPVLIPGGGGYSTVTAGPSVGCAVIESSGVGVCWGDGDVGQLGDGLMMDSTVPVQVMGGPFSDVGGGGGFNCGLGTDLNAYCWGAGTFGQLGNGSMHGLIGLGGQIIFALIPLIHRGQ